MMYIWLSASTYYIFVVMCKRWLNKRIISASRYAASSYFYIVAACELAMVKCDGA